MITRKHVTLRNMSDRIIEEGIDETIDRALDRWRDRPLVTDVHLVSAVPVFHVNGPCFVVVIMDVEIEDEQEKSAGKVYRAKKKE
jgi:hypothetical protein